MKRCTFVFACVLMVGCRVQEPDAAPPRSSSAPEAPPAPHDSTAPVVLLVEGPAAVTDGQEIALRVRLERRPAQADVRVHVELPAGVVTSDALDWTFVPADGPTPERRLRLKVAKVPAADVVVEADAKGYGWGVHAKKAYRFGRAEPMLPDPGAGLSP